MSTIDEIMEQAQVFASGWAMVGSRFDDGGALDEAEGSKVVLRYMIAAALAEARREGAEAMRTQCALVCDATPPRPFRPSIEAAHAIRSLPLPDAPAKPTPMLLTDEQIARAVRHLYASDEAAGMGLQDDIKTARAVEAVVLAANGLGGSK